MIDPMDATGIEPRHLREYLAYIEAARRWAQADPALAAQTDIQQLLAAYPVEEAGAADAVRDPEIADATRRLDAALNGGKIATWVWELETDHLHVDRNMGAFFNVSDPASGVPREVYGSAIHPEDRRIVHERLQQSIRTGEDYMAEYRIITFDPPRWAYARARVEHDEAGRAVRMAGVVMDITERKNAEAALRESESHFRLLADTVPQMVWITYPDGRHAYFNQRWYEFTGVPEGSTGGEGWAGLFHPEDEQRVRAHWRRNLESGEPYEIEYRLRQRGGRYCWFLCRALPVRDAAGQIVRWFGTCTDIDSFKRLQNRLRKSEERFRRVFEHAATGIAIADGHGRFEQCNPAYCALLGYTEEELRQKNLDALVHPEDLAENTELNRRLRLGEIPSVELENRYVRKDGQIVWVRKFVSPLDGTSVGRTRLIALVTDITERRENENALKEAKEAAEAANRGKDRFLAMLSHELRTPLTPVLMTAAELRSDESLPAEVREHLEMIERNVALEARLIDDLLDLTRITRGKLTLRAEPCDLHSLLSLVAEMVQSEARQKQIQVELDLAARQTIAIGDSARLQQVFWNLLRNAVKFTPVGGHVRIHSSDAGDRARIEVSDDGIGFETAAAARIFEPFEQTGSGHRFGGLGLGLSIAKAVVDLHQGTIIAESAGPGKGARFVVELPRAGAAQEESAAPGAHHANGNTRNAEAPMRLLLVEDHEPTREVLTRLLTRAGHQVTTARCLEEARAAALAQSFDAVVSDLGLPDGTGIELMAHLRSAHNLRGIALSGYGMDEDLQRSRDAGFVTHLVKPVDVHQLRHALRILAQSAD